MKAFSFFAVNFLAAVAFAQTAPEVKRPATSAEVSEVCLSVDHLVKAIPSNKTVIDLRACLNSQMTVTEGQDENSVRAPFRILSEGRSEIITCTGPLPKDGKYNALLMKCEKN